MDEGHLLYPHWRRSQSLWEVMKMLAGWTSGRRQTLRIIFCCRHSGDHALWSADAAQIATLPLEEQRRLEEESWSQGNGASPFYLFNGDCAFDCWSTAFDCVGTISDARISLSWDEFKELITSKECRMQRPGLYSLDDSLSDFLYSITDGHVSSPPAVKVSQNSSDPLSRPQCKRA